MANHAIHFTFLTFSVLFAHYGQIANCDTAHTALCAKTPFPELCNSLIPNITQTTNTNSDENFIDFSEISLTETLIRARTAHVLMSTMNQTALTKLGKLALADCLELYEDSIYEISRSLGTSRKGSFFDAQTWLSAAIANSQACEDGFRVFNLSHNHSQLFPAMTSNFSMFLSNSLSIAKNMALASLSKENLQRSVSASDDRFPEWVSNYDGTLLQFPLASKNADIVVAKDGSGHYATIREALTAAVKVRSDVSKRFVIHIKKGVYIENVEIKKSMPNLMFIGDGINVTVISGRRSAGSGYTTFKSATAAVKGDGFMARGITFENFAGPDKGQAVALRSGSDLSVFHRCSFRGYQDTLYVHSHRQFYRECDIYGTVDFIFGDATSYFQKCNIYVRRVANHREYTVTAQGRSDPDETTGIVINESTIKSEEGRLAKPDGSLRGYLGRPWRRYSRTVVMRCSIDGVIDPAGWLGWNGDFEGTVEYYEYKNTGVGALTNLRVKWPGFHVIKRPEVAERFSVSAFLGGDMASLFD